ncbi:6404_t:CDS:2, partial [Gigaspora margarita]
DNKFKVPISILAIGKHFQTIQTICKPVAVLDHDFSITIFVRPQYHINSTLTTHIADIFALVKNTQFTGAFQNEDNIKPLWTFLSAYNPVERSIATFSEKLVKITLPIDKYRTYLGSQKKIQNVKLGLRNFCYAEERLCEL